MRQILVALLFCLPLGMQAQDASSSLSDTVYFDKLWLESDATQAYYTRVRSIEKDIFKVVDYYPNWKLQMKGYYKTLTPEVREGQFQYFKEEGWLESEGKYVDNKKTGLWKSYKDSNVLWTEQEFVEGMQQGFFKSYYDGKILRRLDYYEQDSFKKGNCYTRAGKDTSHYPFIELPTYDGGENAMYQFISKNLNYPSQAINKAIEGKVVLKFMINKEGAVSNIEVVKSIHKSLDDEAIRVVKKMPKWKPGKMEGELSNIYYTLPVKYVLQ